MEQPCGNVLYGADAYSGVINIITKGSSDIQGTLIGGGVGSFKTRDAWVQHGGKLGPVSIAGYLRALERSQERPKKAPTTERVA